MKKRFSFIAGMLTMALLSGLVGTAYAAHQKQATLNYSGIQIALDGEPVTPKDAAGNPVEPFSIDGTTYLPVRAIGEALGLEVGWDGSTNTVILTSPEDEWADYLVCDCYGDFSVPSLENIVGTAALVDVYELGTGDSVLYTYDPMKFKTDPNSNCFEEYFALLWEYGFAYEKAEERATYLKSQISGITVVTYWEEESNYFCVLLMKGEVSSAEAKTTEFSLDAYLFAKQEWAKLNEAGKTELSFEDWWALMRKKGGGQ